MAKENNKSVVKNDLFLGFAEVLWGHLLSNRTNSMSRNRREERERVNQYYRITSESQPEQFAALVRANFHRVNFFFCVLFLFETDRHNRSSCLVNARATLPVCFLTSEG